MYCSSQRFLWHPVYCVVHINRHAGFLLNLLRIGICVCLRAYLQLCMIQEVGIGVFFSFLHLLETESVTGPGPRVLCKTFWLASPRVLLFSVASDMGCWRRVHPFAWFPTVQGQVSRLNGKNFINSSILLYKPPFVFFYLIF